MHRILVVLVTTTVYGSCVSLYVCVVLEGWLSAEEKDL